MIVIKQTENLKVYDWNVSYSTKPSRFIEYAGHPTMFIHDQGRGPVAVWSGVDWRQATPAEDKLARELAS